ncbi:MAG TPA: M23 family metallopeptidase [Micavibrio sp.]|nr:M23 family metallopeptidase [Micavibrio sp.]
MKYGVHILAAGLLVLLAASTLSVTAHAQQSVVINPPTSAKLNQPFQMRTATRAHRGHDYHLSCGTTVNTQAPVKCGVAGGYGNLAEASHGCGVTTRYAHLNNCVKGSTSVVSGGARGSQGAGNSEGCHLHYEIRIDNTAVNPASAFGQNLCDPAVRQKLIQEAQSILGGKAGGGGGMTEGQTTGSGTPGETTTTDSNNIQSVTYIPGGTATNSGAGYFEVVHTDGRVTHEVDLRGEGIATSQIPPTTEEFIQSTSNTNNPVTGCATDTWTAMINQSVLQTRREMAINQRYIVKPDSVMAYSCLSEQFTLVGQHAGVLSESQRWANKQVDILNGNTVTVTVDMGSNSLDGAINNVATEPYEFFLQSFYNYDFLAGQASGLTGSPEGDEDGMSQSHAPCGAMSKVWQIAKCMNVTDDPLFPKFEELISTDPRKFPSNYKCNDTGITQKMIDTARGTKVKKDNVDTYLEMLYTGACHPPISTGITVYRREGADQISKERTYTDGLCITIGCSYQNTGSGNGRCEVKQP